jgi:hypothetical protein
MIKAFLAFLLLCAPALAQSCPGGSCPPPAKRQAPSYKFRAPGGVPAPWTTVVRIKAHPKGGGIDTGTGTVIRGTPAGALAITAAHVLRSGAPLTVEIFGPRMDASTGSVGAPIASFAAVAVDRDDALDVGLVTFDPGRELPASPLVSRGWTPAPGEVFASLGCSRGNDPTGVQVQFGRSSDLQTEHGTYRGYECPWEPPPGRSGGGLFNQSGQLCGVCDMAVHDSKSGLYARAESIYAILDRAGSFDAQPQTKPPPNAPPWKALDKLEREAGNAAGLMLPIAAGLGIGLPTTAAGVLSWMMARAKKKGPIQSARASPESQPSRS